MPAKPKQIGSRRFTDGVERPVFADADGHYIVDGKERIDGVWLVPEDEPEADVPIVVSSR